MKPARLTVWKWILVCSVAGLLHAATWGQSSSKSEAKSGTAATSNLDKSEAQKLRLEWNLRTLVEAYEKVGRKDGKWNEPARKALDTFARVRSGTQTFDEAAANLIATNCAVAVLAGCDDPMIAYLHARHVLTKRDMTARELGDALRQSADALATSQYPDIRKFYAALRTAEQLNLRAGSNTPPDVHRFRHLAIDNLALALKDKSMPIGEVDDACHDILRALKSNKTQYDLCFQSIEKPLFQNWPEESVTWLVKGSAYIDMAWHGRGGGYAETVTDEGWKLFGERLAVAQEALEHAWAMNPSDARIVCKMISVELGQGRGRQRMEQWFRRAMAIDPNYYDACEAKRYYLETKWHGSIEAMLAFGRDCVRTKEWGGHVPLVMIDVQESIVRSLDKSDRAAYWKRPRVWLDIKAALERFFEVEPQAVGWRHNFARYAYLCEQWDDLNKQIALLDPINYDYFGGKAEFDKMVRLAKEHAAKSDAEEKK